MIDTLLRAAAAGLLAASVPAPAGAAPLTGAAAWAGIVGREVAGTTPDGPYTERFAADGTLALADRDGQAGGRWALKGEALCTRVEGEDEECRALELDGDRGAFVDENGARYAFTVRPAAPAGR